MNEEQLAELERLEKAATSPGWVGCAHVRGEVDCPCGFHGNVWDSSGNFVLFEMGAHGEPRADSTTQEQSLNNARYLIALRNAAPALIAAARERDALSCTVNELDDGLRTQLRENDALRARVAELEARLEKVAKLQADFETESGIRARGAAYDEANVFRYVARCLSTALTPPEAAAGEEAGKEGK